MLDKLEKELQRQQAMVEHIRGLLARADEKRLKEPGETRKWNKILNNLETALDEAKARVQKCEREIQREHERVGFGPVPVLSPATTTTVERDARESRSAVLTSPSNAPSSYSEGAEAALTILSAPLDAVENVPLEQVAMAQHYLLWRQDQGLTNGEDKRLEGRIELAIQGGAIAATSASEPTSAQDRRSQHALRTIVDKVLSNQSHTLTVRELELAIDCYSILTRRASLAESEVRLKRLLETTIAIVARLSEEIKRRHEASA